MWQEGQHAGVCRHLGLLNKYHKPFAKKIRRDLVVHRMAPRDIPELQELRQRLGLCRPAAARAVRSCKHLPSLIKLECLMGKAAFPVLLFSGAVASPLRIANGQDMARLLRSRLASEKKAVSKKEKAKSEL